MSGHPSSSRDVQIILRSILPFFVDVFTYRDYQEQCPSAQDVMTIVNTHLSEMENLDNSLPTSIVIGPFHVSVEGVKQNLSKKYKALATSMLDLLAKNLHLQVENVSYLVPYCLSVSCLVVLLKSVCLWDGQETTTEA